MSHSIGSSAQRSTLADWFHKAIQKQPAHFVLAALILFIDFFSGPIFQFPILFVLPVALSAWYVSYKSAILLAVLQPLIRFGFSVMWVETHSFMSISTSFANMFIRIGVLLLLGYFINRSATQSRELSRRVRLFSGNLPICVCCKQIQDEHNDWNEIENYIARNSDTRFTYSLCPVCAATNKG